MSVDGILFFVLLQTNNKLLSEKYKPFNKK